jgi:hypothetical protein
VAASTAASFSPFGKGGRLLARTSFTGGVGYAFSGGSFISADLRPYYDEWNHFAVVSSQASGTVLKWFVNGNLIAQHDDSNYQGVGVPAAGVDYAKEGYEKVKTKIRSLYLCSWTFWSGVYHRGFIDEFRIWNMVRSQEDIKRDMYLAFDRSVAASIPNLVGYWDFDDVEDDRALDFAGGHYDLEFGGCAPCLAGDVPDYKGYTPKRCLPCVEARTCEKNAATCLDHADVWDTFSTNYATYDSGPFKGLPKTMMSCVAAKAYGSPDGCEKKDMLLCAPSDQIGSDSSYQVFGGAHCYKSGPYAASSLVRMTGIGPTFPTKLISSAPIGGRSFDVLIDSRAWFTFPYERAAAIAANRLPETRGKVVIQLNGTDAQHDGLCFTVTALDKTKFALQDPLHATSHPDFTLYYISPSTSNPTYQRVAVGVALPLGVDRVFFAPADPSWTFGAVDDGTSSVYYGGSPFATFQYVANDGLEDSAPLTVTVSVRCPVGRFLNQSSLQCLPCPAGTYMDRSNVASECIQCSVNSAQPKPGMAACTPCVRGTSFALFAGSEQCTTCASLPAIDHSPGAVTLLDDIGCVYKVKFMGHGDSATFRIPVPSGLTAADDDHAVRYGLSPIPVTYRVTGDANRDLTKASATREVVTVQNAVRVSSDIASTIVAIDPVLGKRLVKSTELACGEADHQYYESGILDQPDKMVVALLVEVAYSVYVTSLLVVGVAPANQLLRVEAVMDPAGDVELLWEQGLASIKSETVMRYDLCISTFATTKLKLTFRASVKLDAVEVHGVKEFDGVEGVVLAKGSRSFTVSAADFAQYGIKQQLSLTYTAQQCKGKDSEVRAYVLSLDIYVEPDLKERKVPLPVTIIVLSLAGIGGCLFAAAVLYRNRKSKLVVSLAPTFCYMMLAGLAVVYAWLILNAIAFMDPPHAGFDICVVTPWMLVVSMQSMYALLLAKTWRIHRIFNNTQLRRLHLSNAELLKPVALLLGTIALILAIWFAAAPPKLALVYTNYSKYYICASPQMQVMSYILYIAVGLPMLFGVYLTLQVRAGVKDDKFNESTSIAVVIYTKFLCGVFMLVAVELIKGDENAVASFSIVSFGIFGVATTALVVLFLNKLFIIFFHPEVIREDSMMRMTAGTSRGTLKTTEENNKNHRRESSKTSSAVSPRSTITGTGVAAE